MPGTAYPKEPMYRHAFTKLSPDQILARLGPAARAGPSSASPISDALAGKTIRIATDNGPKLTYKFASPDRLSLTENGGRAIQAGYGALTLDTIVLLAHLIPGTQRGFAVAIDRATNLTTVVELWFSGYRDNREVQREIWYGYVEQPGQDAPAARHGTTNRIEGKGFFWKQDAGPETLEFYPSAAYSHFVELSRQGGEFGYCAPSDYIRISDELYLYARTECEFSGTFTLYVMDLNRVEQIGLRLGFDPHDALEYYLFRGTGEWLGQIAQFEKFGDVAGNPVPRPSPDKGSRRVYRPLQTMPKMTRAEVDAAVAKNSRVFVNRTTAGNGAAGMATNGAAPSDRLAGKAITLRYDDGPALDYRFADAETLHWRFAGDGPWTKARYRAWEAAPAAFIFGHLLEGTPNHDGHMVVVDFDQGLATCFNGTLNTPYFANEAAAKTWFGVIEADGIVPPRRRRHHFTDDLVGSAITWNYAPGLTSMHLYSTPNTVSWIIFTESGAGGMEWSGPGAFVKIRDGLYFAYWLEDACNGTLGTITINLRTMHDAGVGYHCGTEGLNMSQIGAHARHAGKFDILKYYQPKTKKDEA
ncbi:MoaF N-terminal domain-containing protein [Sphingomonas sp. MMS24-J13]|uniref:MoaF N-terminal domain-containing protein n=1 Tax=Sphingomonas sp. MMS24-J13 TaxID=3238686 RepID=UPI00384CE2B3